jgi:molybdate transport system substrate-binding protein
MTKRFVHRQIALLVIGLLWQAAAAGAQELVVMTSGAFTAAHLVLAPQFERATQHKVVTAATSMGTGSESIASRLQRGENVDVVIVAAESIDEFIKAGTVVKGSRVDLARSAIGLAVRSGSRKPDISSVDALKRTLLAANSVAYSASVSGDYLVGELFPKLGIAAEMKAKSRRIERERVGAVVARGEAEIGFQQISELLPIAGIDVVGPLPPGAQRVTIFSAGVAASSKQPDLARAFIQYLRSEEAVGVVVKTGLLQVKAEN